MQISKENVRLTVTKILYKPEYYPLVALARVPVCPWIGVVPVCPCACGSGCARVPVCPGQRQVQKSRSDTLAGRWVCLLFPQTVSPHWGVLTVDVKAGAWSGCSLWSAEFLPVNFRMVWLLWHVEVHFHCAGSHKVYVCVLASSVFLLNILLLNISIIIFLSLDRHQLQPTPQYTADVPARNVSIYLSIYLSICLSVCLCVNRLPQHDVIAAWWARCPSL